MMENGSFHSSPLSVLETDEVVKGIALPFEMPKGLDFSKTLSKERSQSATVETLIGQNEDLMARLGVALRRTTQLEEKLEFFEKENSLLRHRFDTIHDQILVLQQKDKLTGERTQNLNDENSDLQIIVKRLERSYSDLYVQAQDLQSHVMRLERYRNRVQKVSGALQARAKQAGRLNALNVELSSQQAALVQSFETKILEAKNEIDSMQARLQDRDQLFAQKVQLENQIVFTERQHEAYRLDVETRLQREEQKLRLQVMNEFAEARANLEGELEKKSQLESENLRLISEVAALRHQVKVDMVELNNLSNAESQLQSLLTQAETRERNALEQVETLQILWQDKQRQTDKLEDKNSSLQKLNQQLSLNLNQARKEISLLSSELEFERTQAQEKLKVLSEEMSLLNKRG